MMMSMSEVNEVFINLQSCIEGITTPIYYKTEKAHWTIVAAGRAKVIHILSKRCRTSSNEIKSGYVHTFILQTHVTHSLYRGLPGPQILKP